MYNASELLARRQEERDRFQQTVERRLQKQQNVPKSKQKSKSKIVDEELLRRRKESGYNGGDE